MKANNYKMNMLLKVLVVVAVGVGVGCLPCHSSCLDCFGPLQNECSACDSGTLLSLGLECEGDAAMHVQRLQIIGGAPQTPNYVTSLTGNSNYNSSNPNATWVEVLLIELAGLPENYQLQARFAGVVNISAAGCSAYFSLEDQINPVA